MAPDIETLVVGAGAVGLAAARALADAGHQVLVLEQHERVGNETSSRNSEVIHAGLYYPTGSFKARFCVDGKQRLYAFAAENGILARRCGKLVVAADEEERPRLDMIAANARANGVNDLVPLTAAEARVREPNLDCVAAYLSPSTGIIDSHAYMQALEGHITTAGSEIVLHTRVVGLCCRPGGGFDVETDSNGERATFSTRHLVVAAGLDASRIGRLITYANGYSVPETYMAKGHYFSLRGPAPFKHLIYPLPAAGSLGIHYTLNADGTGKFGPDIEWKGVRGDGPIDYSFEEAGGARQTRFEALIRRFWRALPDHALDPAYTGVRPKLTRAGEPSLDFAIHGPQTHGLPGLVALYGIESPGLTSSLAIGAYVADMLTATANGGTRNRE